jgi:hypothetical protein
MYIHHIDSNLMMDVSLQTWMYNHSYPPWNSSDLVISVKTCMYLHHIYSDLMMQVLYYIVYLQVHNLNTSFSIYIIALKEETFIQFVLVLPNIDFDFDFHL